MYTKIIFTILGGDKRQVVIAQKLIERGHTVKIWGMSSLFNSISGAEIFSDWHNAIKDSNVVLLPMPVSRDGQNLSLSHDGGRMESISLNDIVIQASKSGCDCLIGGMIPQFMNELAQNKGLTIDDYYNSDELQSKNALPSAEGAVMIAMEHTDKTIKGLSVLISGYGRIGTKLADILYKLGADVTVAARREESLCEAAMMGYKTLRINIDNSLLLHDTADQFDVIFNTVPHQIFTKRVIDTIMCKPLYIEIASAPGGIDLAHARDAGIEIVFAPSIPGKYAPITAGGYIFEAINDIFETRGISI